MKATFPVTSPTLIYLFSLQSLTIQQLISRATLVTAISCHLTARLENLGLTVIVSVTAKGSHTEYVYQF